MLKTINKYKKFYLIVIMFISFLVLFSASLSFVYGEPSIEINGNVYLLEELSATTTGIDGTPTYQWSSSSDGVVFNDIADATNSTYTVTQNEINKYIKVTITNNGNSYSKVTNDVVKIAFYLDKGNITISSSSGYKGYAKNGTVISGNHIDTNKYVVTQTDSTITNTNGISLDGILNNCDLTLDGINTSALNSISIPALKGQDKNVVIRLKNTNTINNILYYTAGEQSVVTTNHGNSSLKITSFEGDGKTSGVLNVLPNGSVHWNSGIGGTDNISYVSGLCISGGTLNVITTKDDDCAAIGAGGNGFAEIKITGGKIYAESASTGATIGGGVGYSSPGPGANIEISGGEIEAINYGNNNQYSGNTDVYGVAIGGGGTYRSNSYDATITITGGKVKTTVPNGATAIGAGNSNLGTGGNSTVNISGGEIIAKGNIGGGSVTGSNTSYNGGSSTVNISGGFISVDGNIGGGSATKGKGGYSEVSITGGTILSDSIGGGYSIKNGYNSSHLTITGGSLNSEVSSTPTNGTENVYLTPITFYNTSDYYSNSLIKSLKGIDSYGIKDVKTDVNGKAYFWLPNTSVITEATDNDNNVYTGIVPSKSQGLLKYNTSMNFYTINLTEDSKYYNLYLDKELTNKYTGTVYKTSDSTFHFYVDKKTDSSGNLYPIDVYASNSDGVMKKITPKSTNNNVEEYELTILTNNIEVWFVITDGSNKILKLDLNSGDIKLTKNSNDNLDVTVDKYRLLNYDGGFTLTSLGFSTANNLTLVSGNANILISNLIAHGNRSVINVDKGTLILKSDNYDNQITSTNAPAIDIREGANINITMEDGNSLKINSSTNSAIGGKGTIILSKSSGAHLTLSKNASYSQITANKYTYTTNGLSNTALPYGLNLPNLIGYHNSTDNRLYDLTKTYTLSNATTFKATSLNTTLRDLTETHKIDENGNLVITLSSKPATLTILRDNEVLESSNWITDNVLTIPASEAYYNLSIVAAKYLTYNYVANDYNNLYDGNPHSVNVDVTNVTNVDVYYSTTMLDNSNYKTAGSTTSPQLTNVGNLPVYFYIPQATYNDNVYKEASGVIHIIINKADNRWNLALGIPNIVQGMTLNPFATARWGETTYSYYQYINGEYVEATPIVDGTYFVKAFVEGTDNYNPLESNYVMFNIESTALVNVVKGRDLLKITDGFKTSETNPIEISKDGVLSAYMAFRYTPNASDKITFKFSQSLPVNTKITLIDFNSSTPTYYRYEVNTALSSLAINDFIKMGTTNTTLAPPTSGGEMVAEYQIILDFSKTTNNINQLKTGINQGSNKITKTDFYAVFSGNNDNNISLGNITNETGKMRIPINVKANDFYLKTLDIKLTDESNNDIALPLDISAELLSEDGTKHYGFIRKNHIFMTIDKELLDEKYTLILDNLTTNKYKINVKLYENNNSKAVTSNTIEITGKNQDSIHVKDLVLSDRFIENNSTITFNVKYTSESARKVLVYRSLKENGTYNSKELVDSISIAELSGELNIPITINQSSGIWRYYFEIGNSTDVYNIIVK